MSSSDLKENIYKFNNQITKCLLNNIYLSFITFICTCHPKMTYKKFVFQTVEKAQVATALTGCSYSVALSLA